MYIKNINKHTISTILLIPSSLTCKSIAFFTINSPDSFGVKIISSAGLCVLYIFFSVVVISRLVLCSCLLLFFRIYLLIYLQIWFHSFFYCILIRCCFYLLSIKIKKKLIIVIIFLFLWWTKWSTKIQEENKALTRKKSLIKLNKQQ